jgi:hypothetical protein
VKKKIKNPLKKTQKGQTSRKPNAKNQKTKKPPTTLKD